MMNHAVWPLCTDEADMAQRSEGLRTELALWEAVLSKSPFLAGDGFTLADVAAGACHHVEVMGILRAELVFKMWPELRLVSVAVTDDKTRLPCPSVGAVQTNDMLCSWITPR